MVDQKQESKPQFCPEIPSEQPEEPEIIQIEAPLEMLEEVEVKDIVPVVKSRKPESEGSEQKSDNNENIIAEDPVQQECIPSEIIDKQGDNYEKP